VKFLETLDGLHAHYGTPKAASTRKEAPRITPEYRRLIEASPFCGFATLGLDGMDCSPRGDQPGQLVRILDEVTPAMPDWRGNDRIDTRRNIIRARLWEAHGSPDVPTAGQILAAMTAGDVGGARYDAEWPERARKSMW